MRGLRHLRRLLALLYWCVRCGRRAECSASGAFSELGSFWTTSLFRACRLNPRQPSPGLFLFCAPSAYRARRALDDIIFDVLGLTQGERDAVYEAVIHLVEARLSKARSLSKRR